MKTTMTEQELRKALESEKADYFVYQNLRDAALDMIELYLVQHQVKLSYDDAVFGIENNSNCDWKTTIDGKVTCTYPAIIEKYIQS